MVGTSNAFFQAVVVGGGPAGSACAFTLASSGVQTLLVDKAVFPRDKLCGGLVTEKAVSEFERVFRSTLDASLLKPSSDISFSNAGRPLATLRFAQHGTVMHFTMRAEFDSCLLNLARSAGVLVRTGTSVQSIDVAARKVLLADGSEVGYGHLVGADGANSVVARTLFGRSFDPGTIGFGMEVEVPRADLPSQGDMVEIDFAGACWGYGWVFPKHRTYTIGVGGLHRRNPKMKSALAAYLIGKGLDPERYRAKGQYIPFGDFRRIPGRGDVLLCGDAAGTVDSITGEGIAYAIRTGAAAGEAIARAVRDPSLSALSLYQEQHREVANAIRSSNRWRHLIFPAAGTRLFASAFADAGTLHRWFLQLLAGRHGYEDLPPVFASQLKKGLLKLARSLGRRVGLARR